MLQIMNHKWFRGILISAALLAPLGYIGLRNGFARAQMGTPITPGSSVGTTLVPSTTTTTNLSVGSTSADTGLSPASGLSTSSTDAQDPHAMSVDPADNSLALNSVEDEANLVEIAAADDGDSEDVVAEDGTDDEDAPVSQDDSNSNYRPLADRPVSRDDGQ